MSRVIFDNPQTSQDGEYHGTERRLYHRRTINVDRREILRFEEGAEPRRNNIDRRMNNSYAGSCN